MNISGILFTIALLIRSFCLLVNELKYITTPSSIVAGTVLEDVTESVTFSVTGFAVFFLPGFLVCCLLFLSSSYNLLISSLTAAVISSSADADEPSF